MGAFKFAFNAFVLVFWNLVLVSFVGQAFAAEDSFSIYNGPGYVSSSLPGVLTVPFGEQGRKASNVTPGTPSQLLFEKYMYRTTSGHFRVKTDLIRSLVVEIQSHFTDAKKWSGSSKRAFITFEAATDELNSAIRFGEELNRRVDSGLLSLQTDKDLNANLPLLQDFYESLLQGLEIYDNLRGDDAQIGTMFAMIDALKGNAGRIYLHSNIPEAVNVLPASALQGNAHFRSPKELKQAGAQISQLDPKASGFWAEPDPNYDTRNYNRTTENKVGMDLLSPDSVLEAEFGGAWGGTGVTPKIRVKIRLPGEKEPVDAKLKLRVTPAYPLAHSAGLPDFISTLRNAFSEVSVETAANNLAAAIGYRIQPTYTKNHVHLFLPDDKALGQRATGDLEQRKKQAWSGFSDARKDAVKKFKNAALGGSGAQIDWDYAGALSDVEFDQAKNRWYVKLAQSQIEIRESMKTGFFARHRFGRVLKREFRAFEVFGALIYDVDRKDSNSGTLLEKVEDRWKIKYVAADMGSAFGYVFFLKDAINFFPADLVPLEFLQGLKKSSQGKDVTVPINFKPMYLGPMLNAVSVNDARWLVSKLLKLSDDQVRGAFEGAGYHQCLVDLYAAKMHRRTHQLAMAVGMANQKTVSLKVDQPFEFKAAPSCQQFMNVKKLALVEVCDSKEKTNCSTEYIPASSVRRDMRVIGKATALGNDIVTAPPGVTNDQLLSARDIGGPDSLQRQAATGAANVGAILGGQIASTWVDRLQISFGNWLSGLDGQAGGRGLGVVIPLTAIRVPLENPFYRNSKVLEKTLGKNPISKEPYWAADIFRCGEGVGSNAVRALGLLPLARSDMRFVRVRELIRIRAAGQDVLKESFGKAKELLDFNALKAACFGLDDDFMKTFDANGTFVQTDYYLFGMAERARGLLEVGPSASAGFSIARSNRIVAMKAEGEKLLVLRQKATTRKLGATGGISLIVAQLPVVGVNSSHINEDQEAILLKAWNPAVLNRVMDLSAKVRLKDAFKDDEALDSREIESKVSTTNRTSFFASLLGIMTKYSGKSRSRVVVSRCPAKNKASDDSPKANQQAAETEETEENEAGEEALDCKTDSFDQISTVNGKKGWDLLSDGGPRRTSADRFVSSGIQSQDGLTTYFSLVYKKLTANRDDLVSLLKRLKKIYPSSMVPIDPTDKAQVQRLNDNQGELSFEGPFVISQEGWVNLFEKFKDAPTNELPSTVCRLIVTEYPFLSRDFCESGNLEKLKDHHQREAISKRSPAPERTIRALYTISVFSTKLSAAITEYRRLMPLGAKTQDELLPLRNRALDLLSDDEQLEFTIGTLKNLVGREGYRFLKPRITSSLEALGLMGGEHELEEAEEGGLDISAAALTVSDQAWTAADFMFSGLAPYLYDYDRIMRMGFNTQGYADWMYVNSETANRARKTRQIGR